MDSPWVPGVAAVLAEPARWLPGRRVGLVTNAAAVGPDGTPSAELFLRNEGCTLACLFVPEHGYDARSGAGEPVPDRPPGLAEVPVFSLYGARRGPTAEMLDRLDVLVFDLPCLATRCYTYISTLRYVMEAAARHGKPLVVADRPVALPDVCDGPLLDTRFESFVACVPFPLAYGLTPGEAALLLKRELQLDLELRVAPMSGYARDPDWPAELPWRPPSPGIRSWETAQTYPATVWAEALPALDYGRGANWVFQMVGAPWVDSHGLRAALAEEQLPGVFFEAFCWTGRAGLHSGREVRGVRIVVTDPRAFRPVQTAVALLAALQKLYGRDRIWGVEGTRPDFFDQLMGTDAVRRALGQGATAGEISAAWNADLETFRKKREAVLLY